jgi:alpha-D-ribose 1-methylphosphonate 5-triphosphate synthase subunit PhnG
MSAPRLSCSRYILLVSDLMTTTSPSMGHTGRAAWMRILSLSPWSELEPLAREFLSTPHDVLRAPEAGLVMLRGRMGATGAAFNFGEAAVTRCAVRLADGPEGHAYVMGRNTDHARLAAVCDALLQTVEHEPVMARVIAPLEARLQQNHIETAGKAAATKVDFFTMVRGDV